MLNKGFLAAAVVTGWLLGHPLPDAARAESIVVPLTIDEPTGQDRRNWPVTSGIPFAQGALPTKNNFSYERGPAATFVDEAGVARPVQTRVTCRWPDGSIKWLLLDSRVDLDASESRSYRFLVDPEKTGGQLPAVKDAALRIEPSAEAIRIDTGPLRLVVPREGSGLVSEVSFDADGQERWTADNELSAEPWSIRLVTADGTVYRSDPVQRQVTVEEAGPLRGCVRIAGRLADARNQQAARYVTRLHLFVGQPFVRAQVTLIVDVPDRAMLDIASFELTVPCDDLEAARAVFGGEAQGIAVHDPIPGTADRRLFQQNDRRYLLDGQPAGSRAAGWLASSGTRAGVSAGVRHFWQQWPQALRASDGKLVIELIPAFPKDTYTTDDPYERARWTFALDTGATRLKQGVAKTFETWVCCHPAGTPPGQIRAFYARAFEPLLATCAPEYICATKALGDFPPSSERAEAFLGLDGLIAEAFAAHLDRREKTGEYGLLNFGDWWGERGANWGNLEYDMPRGLIVQYARTGRRDYFMRAAEAARHHVDVDIVHATNEHMTHRSGPPPAVGDVWLHATGHTGGYFEDDAFDLSWHYTDGYSRNLGHVWSRGDLDYAFLSGDEWAKEAALSVAERLAKGYAPHFRIGDHMRDIGWPMIAMLAGYRATGQPELLDAVRHGWHVLRDAQDPGGGWSITLARGHCLCEGERCKGNVSFIMAIVISALCDYHRETGDPEVADAIVGAVDFTIREMYLPDRRIFRYTSCAQMKTTSPRTAAMLAESIAYAYRLSGNPAHREVLLDSLGLFADTVREQPGGSAMGKGFSQMLIFLHEGLWPLEPAHP